MCYATNRRIVSILKKGIESQEKKAADFENDYESLDDANAKRAALNSMTSSVYASVVLSRVLGEVMLVTARN